MPEAEPTIEAPGRDGSATEPARVAILGNPNVGKTTLFNRLCGLRHKTSNFPGTTQEARVGVAEIDGDAYELIDLPGLYSLELDQAEAALCRALLAGEVGPAGERVHVPERACIVVDATNLARNLTLAGEALRRRLPTTLIVTMTDAADRLGLRVDVDLLAARLGCPVVSCVPRSGEGVGAARRAIAGASVPTSTPPGDEAGLLEWAEALSAAALGDPAPARDDSLTDRLDRALTHPALGLAVFAVIMTGLFWTLFRLATIPMDLIDAVFSGLSGWVAAVGGGGIIADAVGNGVIAGVGATLVFLPQIALLFFLITLLEDTGYLARASFVMDRLLRRFGLPGHAFVPLLSSHACALPGIMACRAIPDRRERLAAILVAPFMTCSARLPVYALLVVVLFPGRPGVQALAFTGCYALGVVAGLLSALVARRTLLRGEAMPMAMELPPYRAPSLRNAIVTAWDRSAVFLRKAGTVILAITIVLWWLGAYPRVEPSAEVEALRAEAAAVSPEAGAALERAADELEARQAASSSFMGRVGRTVQPVFEPLGYDWQLSVGVMASFAAREVFVSTMAVVVSGREDEEGLLETLATAERTDGRGLVFAPPVAWSLLVYYVLAMQCLPTLAVTAREAGGVRWAALQLGWMTLVAYGAAFIAYRVALAV